MNITAEKKAYKRFLKEGMTPQGACGLMGNLEAESDGFFPNRVEYLCLKRLKEKGKTYTDKTYTKAVNSGQITRAEFLNPLPGRQYGYGLAQWTSPGRKAGLYDLAKARNVSIANLNLQLDFLLKELKTSYTSVLKVLKTTTSIQEASDAVLTRFECPSDCGERMKASRAQRGWRIYSSYAADQKPAAARTAENYLNVWRSWIGFSEANGKFRQIIDLYNSCKPLARGYAVQYGDEWCDTAVSAAAIKAGMVDLIGTECGCEEHVNIFKKLGIWIEDGTVTPKPGYIIVYNWDMGTQPNDDYSDHIGVVESVRNGVITCIEGNKNEEVGYRSIPVGWGFIRGFAAPEYEEAKTRPSVSDAPAPEKDGGTAGPGSINTTPGWVGKVTADVLNVRTWAGEENPNIKSWPQLTKGNLVDICDRVDAKDGSVWYYVRIDGRIFGFIHSDFVKKM